MSDDGTAAESGGTGGGLQRPDGPPEWLSLDEGEQLQWVGQPASISLVPAAVWGVVLLPVLGLGLLVFAAAYLTVTNTDYVVTNTTLYHKRGVLSTNIESVGLDRIQNTEYSQSFAGKQFGYGTIEISTAGSGGADLAFRSVEQPREVRDLVTRLAGAVGGQTGATGGAGGEAAPAATGGADEELLRELLAELRAVNESMSNVERMLREGGGGTAGRAAGSATATDSGGSTGGGTSGSGTSGGGTAGGGSTDAKRDTASEFVSSTPDPDDEGTDGASDERSDGEDDAPPAPPFGDDGG